MRSLLLIILISGFSQIYSQQVFVVNSGSETLSKIDLENDTVENTFSSLGSLPNKMALTNEFAYVLNSGDNNIQKIDLQNGATLNQIFLGSSVNPYDIIIHAGFAYVTGAFSNRVYKIDLITESVLDNVLVGNNPAGMVIQSGFLYVGNTDYMSNYQDCSISVIDLEDFSLVDDIETEPNPINLLNYNGKIHISCCGNWVDEGGKISILNPEIQMIEFTFEMGGYTGNLTELNGTVYVSDLMNSGIYAYNGITYDIIHDHNNPFLPGGTAVCSGSQMLVVLGGEWGQNFTVWCYDELENLLADYMVGLYGTDVKIREDESSLEDKFIPKSLLHSRNYPNPFNPVTEIFYEILHSCEVELKIYNIRGQKIVTLVDSFQDAGNYQITWKADRCSAGIYFYKLEAGNDFLIKKMELLK